MTAEWLRVEEGGAACGNLCTAGTPTAPTLCDTRRGRTVNNLPFPISNFSLLQKTRHGPAGRDCLRRWLRLLCGRRLHRLRFRGQGAGFQFVCSNIDHSLSIFFNLHPLNHHTRWQLGGACNQLKAFVTQRAGSFELKDFLYTPELITIKESHCLSVTDIRGGFGSSEGKEGGEETKQGQELGVEQEEKVEEEQ